MDTEISGTEYYAMDPIWQLQAIKWYCVEICRVNRHLNRSLLGRFTKTNLCPIIRSL